MKKTITLAAALLILSLSANAQRNYVLVGHRGGANLGNENTISCLSAGIAAGADMVEIDVHLTSDGEIVVCHDPTLDRTTDTKGVIANMTLEEVKAARIVDSKTGETTDETIPTLREVMDLCDHECQLLIEIKRKKDEYQGIEQKVADMINDYEAKNWAVVQSFDDSILENMHQVDSTIRLQKLIVMKVGGLAISNKLSKFKLENYDYAEAINVDYHFANKTFIRKMHEAGKKVGVWTINTRKQVDKLLNCDDPVDIVITNSPDIF